MDPVTLGTQLNQPEGQQLEFKAGTVRSDAVARILGAFAHKSGGTLVCGVDERQRSGVGVDDPDAAERRIREGLARVRPQPDAALERIELDASR